ncbi:MAG: PD-(D/E)XK nuclease family protein [Actinomycetota bacterium]|nr:PD-(D/E)XK nuclease family protein [Actinomycetota bacterium]
MAASFVFTAYGADATDALAQTVASVKNGDSLAPVTVVVPSNLVGVSARRALATRSPAGLTAARFETVLGLARLLSGPSLPNDRRRVTDPVVGAAVRSILETSADVLRPVSHHPATERALVRVHRELRELDEVALTALADAGQLPAEVVRLYREIHHSLADHYVDEVALHQAAAATVAAGHPLLDGLGALVLHLPDRLPASGLRLVETLAANAPLAVVLAHTGNAEADAPLKDLVDRLGGAFPLKPPAPSKSRLLVRSVADPDEEVRLAIREVLAGARSGISFSRMAIAHPGSDRYARLLHQHLAATGVPFNGVAGRRLSESLTGRTLLAMLALPDHDLTRTAVMAVLSSGAILGPNGRPVPATAWERLAREANVVAGLSQWEERLRHYGADQDARLAELEAEGADASRRRGHRERRARADDLLTFVQQLANDLDPAQRPTDWPGLTRWAVKLLEVYLGPPHDRSDWPPEEIDAYSRVVDLLRNLASLATIETAPGMANFRRAVANGLDCEVDREGRFGNGVFVGGFGTTAGLDVDRVVAVGLTEGVMPPRIRDDPLLSDSFRRTLGGALSLRAERQADLHRSVLATFATGKTDRVLVFPRGDLGDKTETVPSRWLLDEVEADLGERPSPAHLEGLKVGWFTTSSSFAQSLEQLNQPADQHEYALAELLRDRHRGLLPDVSNRRLSDRVLNRGIQLIRGREAPQLTRFDGLLDRTDLPSPADGRTILSATRLENWVKCPHAYFMRYVLGVETLGEPADEDGITSLEHGSLAHEILDRFLTESLEAHDVPSPDAPWGPAHHQRIDVICDEEFALVELRGLTGRPLLWRRDGGQLKQALHEFLLDDNERRSNNLLTPIAAEMGFGLDGNAPLMLHLADGRPLRFRGRIDRVDRAVGGGLVVTDFKTGKKEYYNQISEDSPDANGQYLQLPMYGLAARERLATPDADVDVRYWFLTDSGKVVGHPLSDSVLERFDQVLTTIIDGIEQGCFPARPPKSSYGIRCDYCDPDDLGTESRTDLWDRKRHDPRLDDYRHLIGDLPNDGPIAVIDLEDSDG